MSAMAGKSNLHSPDERSAAHLLVSLPALNEERTIGEVIAAIPSEIPGVSKIEVLVVDDGSTDNTAAVAAEAGAHVIQHDRCRGVGAAFQTALDYATERGVGLILTIDADGQFNPADIPKLVAPVVAGEADVSTASRFKDRSLTPEMPWIKRWGNRKMSQLVSRLAGQKFYDVSCGMRCYNQHALLSLNLMGTFTCTQEVILNLSFKGFKIVEIPIPVRGERAHGKSRIADDLWRYAFMTSRIIFRAYRDYNPMRLFGMIALLLFVPAVMLEVLFLGNYLITGRFWPHKWAGFTGGVLAVLSVMMLYVGMIGDMLNRHRVYLEELLYDQRRRKAGHRESKTP
jgi:glycosyltransferase involved in cell wall biosynthesis